MRPQRRFAAPIVVTAALAGCASGPTTNNSPHLPEAPIANPPPRQIEPEAKPPVHANPPPRQIEPPVPALPMPTNPAAVEKRADGTCVEVHHVTCPPNVRCNPPPPSPVQCPPGK